MTIARKEELLSRIGGVIKGKPVEKTLAAMYAGKPLSKWTELKGLSSLFTHIAIECEHGRAEYAELLTDLHTVIGEVLNG
jgi:hypothetical protein